MRYGVNEMSGLLPMGYLASSPGVAPMIGDINHVRTRRISRRSFDRCVRSVHVPLRTVAGVFSLVVSMVAFGRQVGLMRLQARMYNNPNGEAERLQQAKKGHRRTWRGRPSKMQPVSLCTGYTDRPVHMNLRSRVHSYRLDAIVSSDDCKGISPVYQANVQLREYVRLSHRHDRFGTRPRAPHQWRYH